MGETSEGGLLDGRVGEEKGRGVDLRGDEEEREGGSEGGKGRAKEKVRVISPWVESVGMPDDQNVWRRDE